MIKRHKSLPAAPDETIIWHYMSVPHFLYLLNRRLLYFSRVDSLDDKAEILVSEIEKKYWKNAFKNDLDPWIARERKRVFINCWIKSDEENSLMWLAYADHGKGVVIKTTVGDLIRSYSGEDQISILDVDYIDYRGQTVQRSGERINVRRFFAAKRKPFEAEQELRLIYESSMVEEYSFYQIPVDVDVLIKELRVGPNAGEDVFSAIKTLVADAGCVFNVQYSDLLYP